MGAGVEPGVAAAHGLDVEFVAREVGFVDVGDLELTARRRLDLLRDIDDVLVVEVEARHGEVGLRRGWLFLEAHGLALLVKLDDAVALRVADVVGEDRRAVRLCGRALHHHGEVGAVEDVVAQDERTALAREELLPDQERLCESLRFRLHGVRDGDAPLRAIAEQPPEVRIVLRRRDHEDVPDAREHQRRQRVVDHRLVVDRHQLLRHRDRQRVKARPRAARQDNSLTNHSSALIHKIQRRRHALLERWRLRVLVRQDHRLKRPRDADVRVIPADVAVALRRVVVVRLVLHLDVVRQRDEAVRKAARDEELLLVLR